MKYILSGESKILPTGVTVYRIKSSDGKPGGFVESEDNLSQEGACWLHGDSLAFGNARVLENSQVFGEARDNAVVQGAAQLYGRAFGHAVLRGRCKVYGAVGGSHVVEGDEVVYGFLE